MCHCAALGVLEHHHPVTFTCRSSTTSNCSSSSSSSSSSNSAASAPIVPTVSGTSSLSPVSAPATTSQAPEELSVALATVVVRFPFARRKLHFVKRLHSASRSSEPGQPFMGAMVTLDECHQKVFGPGSPVRVKSKSTLLRRLNGVTRAHSEVCTDPAIRALLTRRNVVGRQAPRILLLSLPAVVYLLGVFGASQSVKAPLEALDADGLFEHGLSGGPDTSPQQHDETLPQGNVDQRLWDDDEEDVESLDGGEQAGQQEVQQQQRQRQQQAAAAVASPLRQLRRVQPLPMSSHAAAAAPPHQLTAPEPVLHQAGAEEAEVLSQDDDSYLVDEDEGADWEAELERAMEKEARAAQRREPLSPSPLASGRRLSSRMQQHLTGRFGLPSSRVPSLERLSRQLNSFRRSAMDAGVNPMRYGVFQGQVTKTTLEDVVRDILKFLGYACNVRGMAEEQLSLRLYAEGRLFTSFLDFMDARSCSVAELKRQVSVAIKVNTFLCNLLMLDAGYRPSAKDNPHYRALQRLRPMLTDLGYREKRERGADVE
jgi:hypothetical protein